MTIRRLIPADTDRMVHLIMLHYAQMREHQARAILEDPGHPFVLFGDPDVPTLCKLQHYAPFMSPAPDVTTAKATHVSNLYPMSVEALISLGILTEDQVSPATLLLFLDQSIAPLLAESLGQLNDWSRAGAAGTERRAVSGRRVWALLPERNRAAFGDHLHEYAERRGPGGSRVEARVAMAVIKPTWQAIWSVPT